MSTLQDGGWRIINTNAKYCRIQLTLLAGWSPRFWIYSDMDNKPFPDLSSPLWWGPEQHFGILFCFSVQKTMAVWKRKSKLLNRHTQFIHLLVLLGDFVVLELHWGFVGLLFVFFFFYWQVYGRFSMNWEYWCRAGASLRFLSRIQCAVDTQWSASNLWLNTPLWTGDCVSPGCGSSCMVPGHAVMQKSAKICKNRF